MVRARVKGDIKAVIPGASEVETEDADYRFRSIVTRREFAVAMERQIKQINYYNFKDSIPKKQKFRKNWYMDVWSAGMRVQDRFTPPLKRWWETYRYGKVDETIFDEADRYEVLEDDDDLSWSPDTRGV